MDLSESRFTALEHGENSNVRRRRAGADLPGVDTRGSVEMDSNEAANKATLEIRQCSEEAHTWKTGEGGVPFQLL